MPAAGNLAALMKEWPLNSTMLSTATHSKLREVLDGIDTQVATCTIDRWTAKMKEGEEYTTREISRRSGGQFRRHQKALVVQHQRRRTRTHPQTRPEDGLWPSPPTTPLTILLPNDPAWPLTKSLQRPSSWARFSTKFIVLGLLGLGSLTSTVKDTYQNGTLQKCMKKIKRQLLLVLKSTICFFRKSFIERFLRKALFFFKILFFFFKEIQSGRRII